MFIKSYIEVLEECKDRDEWNIICLILSRYKSNNKIKIQQTYIAKTLYMDKKTVSLKLKSIIEKKLLKKKATYIIANGIKQSTTEFEILPKLKNLIETHNQSVKNSTFKSKAKEHALSENNVGITEPYKLQSYLYAQLNKPQIKN